MRHETVLYIMGVLLFACMTSYYFIVPDNIDPAKRNSIPSKNEQGFWGTPTGDINKHTFLFFLCFLQSVCLRHKTKSKKLKNTQKMQVNLIGVNTITYIFITFQSHLTQ